MHAFFVRRVGNLCSAAKFCDVDVVSLHSVRVDFTCCVFPGTDVVLRGSAGCDCVAQAMLWPCGMII